MQKVTLTEEQVRKIESALRLKRNGLRPNTCGTYERYTELIHLFQRDEVKVEVESSYNAPVNAPVKNGEPYYRVEERDGKFTILDMWNGGKADVLDTLKDANEQAYKLRCHRHPQVGDPATAGYGSDCYPYTVVCVNSAQQATKIGVCGNQTKNGEVVPVENPGQQEPTRFYTLRKNGKWVLRGDNAETGQRLYLGFHKYYQDPSF